MDGMDEVDVMVKMDLVDGVDIHGQIWAVISEAVSSLEAGVDVKQDA